MVESRTLISIRRRLTRPLAEPPWTTYNLDFEVFKSINLSSLTSLEMSAGLRYNDTEYFYNGPTNPNDFTGSADSSESGLDSVSSSME